MTNTGNDGADKPASGNVIGEESHVYEDEINLMEYFLVIWKHKWFILACSVLPALIVGLSTYMSPRSYVVTYTYDVSDDAGGYAKDDVSNWNLNEKNLNILQSRFYSEESLDKIVSNLQEVKVDEYTWQDNNSSIDISRHVKFTVLPPFVDLFKVKVTDSDQIEKLRGMEASLLRMTITGKPKEVLKNIALAVRSNFEEVIPLYMIQEQLSADINEFNREMARIECSRFNVELSLKNSAKKLAGLKKIDISSTVNNKSNIVLHFNTSEQSRYLPLSCQIQSLESEIVELNGTISTDESNYKYYEDMSGLITRMVAELNDKLSSGQNNTIALFKSYLIDQINETEKQELKDYLSSYLKRIENRISASAPVSDNPAISPMPKGLARKLSMTFATAFVLSIIASFLLNSINQRKSGL